MELHDNVTIVCGGRGYHLQHDLANVLDQHRPSCIISGGAKGADSQARIYAHKNGVPFIEMPALWEYEGKSAGPWRNKRMAAVAQQLADQTLLGVTLVVCPGGRGTASMRSIGEKKGFRILDV